MEIWHPNDGNWFQESILRGGKGRTIEGLVWTQDVPVRDDEDEVSQLRLFSIGDSTAVTEWDLVRGTPKRHADGNAGDIWCLAAQPRLQQKSRGAEHEAVDVHPAQLLAAGCGSGTIVLFSTADGELEYLRSLGRPPVKKPKVLSLTWRDRNTLVAGYDDSAIRIYDISSKRTLRTMSLGPSAEGNESYVWCVKCLKDGTILSGDSTGELKLWDAKNYSLYQRLKTHVADILDIGITAADDKIFTVGVDRRTVAYKRLPSQSRMYKNRWTELMHRRLHHHDIKSVATFESKELSIMVSGGVDTTPIVTPMREWQKENHRSLSHLPQSPQLAVSRSSRLILTWWEREIWIWHVRPQPHQVDLIQSAALSGPGCQVMARLRLKGDEHITSAHISETGDLVAVSTASTVKLFQLRWSRKDGDMSLRSRQVDLPASMRRLGAKLVKFSPDSRWLCAVRLDNMISLARVLRTANLKEQPRILDKVIRLNRKPRLPISKSEGDSVDPYAQKITHVEFSEDCRALVSADLSGAIDVWALEGSEDQEQIPAVIFQEPVENLSDQDDSDVEDDDDSRVIILGQRWIRHPTRSTLPQLNSAVLALAFRPVRGSSTQAPTNDSIGLHPTRRNPHPISHEALHSHHKLVTVTASHEIVEFEVATGRLSEWSRRNPSKYLPDAFTRIRDRTMDCFWDLTGPQDRLWMYGATWLFMLDMSQDLPLSPSIGRLGNYEVLEPVENMQKKRQIDATVQKSNKRRNTGAGSQVSPQERYLAIGSQVRRFKDEGTDLRVFNLNRSRSPVSDEDEEIILNGDFASARRALEDHNEGSVAQEANPNNPIDDHKQDREVIRQVKQPGWWHTFQYRSVFGIVPLGPIASDDDADEVDPTKLCPRMEVVIIERPLYDVELPPRFDGGQDWET